MGFGIWDFGIWFVLAWLWQKAGENNGQLRFRPPPLVPQASHLDQKERERKENTPGTRVGPGSMERWSYKADNCYIPSTVGSLYSCQLWRELVCPLYNVWGL